MTDNEKPSSLPTDNLPPNGDDEELKFYTTSQVAKMLEVTKGTVRIWIQEGKLKGVVISNRYRVSHQDLKRFIEERYS